MTQRRFEKGGSEPVNSLDPSPDDLGHGTDERHGLKNSQTRPPLFQTVLSVRSVSPISFQSSTFFSVTSVPLR